MRLYTRLKEILNEPVYQVAIILFLFEAVFVSQVHHVNDVFAFSGWCNNIHENGIGNIYKFHDPDYNYPPLLTYILYLFGVFEGSTGNITVYFYFFKVVALFADFIAAISLVVLLKDKGRSVLWLLLLVATPVFIYNSYCWGQVDGILSLLVFIAFLFALKGKLTPTVLFLTLAVNFKAHAIIFLPPLVLLAYNQLGRDIKLKTILFAAGTIIITQLLILLPFFISGQAGKAWQVMTGPVGFYGCTSCNAYNVWFYLLPKNRIFSPDEQIWNNLSYRLWGLIMFCTFSFIALLPLFLSALSRLTKRTVYRIDRDSLFIVFALIPLVFFYFNTEMHERFGHTTLIFTAAFAFSSRRYWLFALICAAYFGNMEGILHFFNFPFYGVLIFNPYWVASLYLVLIVCLIYFLYKPFILQVKMNRLKPALTGDRGNKI